MTELTPNILLQMSETDRIKALELLSEIESRKKREAAQKDFLEFVKVMWPEFIHGSHHAKMARAFERVARGELKRLIINMPPRHAIMTSMNIPTTQGMKTMADLQPGDYVFGPDGKPTQVLGKSEIFKDRQLYQVTTDDGFSLIVDGEHLWTVSVERKNRRYFDYTTEQLWERQNGAVFRASRVTKEIKIQNLPPVKAENVRAPMLPFVQPTQYSEKELLVDPYVLGLWLGDGSKNNAVITSHTDDQPFVRAEIERRGYTTNDQTTKYTFSVIGLQTQLREIGVLGNKHIPEIYLQGSVQQRRDLLKGLMDSDGNVSKKGQCYFAQKSLDLINQVRGLLASLGIKNSLSSSEAKIKNKSYGMHHKISFYASDIAILPRKEERTLKNDRTFGRYIRIEKLNILGDTQCIKVDREDGLFLAGEGYICTHNTKSEFASNMLPAWFLGLYPHKQVMQISHTADMAEGFGRKVRNLVDSDIYNSVFPDTRLRRDSTAAARWNTDKNGVYIAMGVGGAVAGKGADLLIIDDPCLVEGTLVLTQYGLKEIQNITLEDKVWGRDGLYEVKALLTTRHDETTVINRNLTVSSNHPIWTTNRGWVAAKDLQTTDIMLTNRLPYNIMKFFLYLWRTTWLKVKQVTQQNQNTTFGQ